jgi:hypothetical protein
VQEHRRRKGQYMFLQSKDGTRKQASEKESNVQKGSEETDLISSRKHSYINNKNI